MNFFPHFAHTQQPAKKWGKKCSTGRGSFAPKLLLTKSILKCKNVTFLDLICQDLSLLLLLILLTFTNNILINLFAFLVLTIFFPLFSRSNDLLRLAVSPCSKTVPMRVKSLPSLMSSTKTEFSLTVPVQVWNKTFSRQITLSSM